MNSRSAIIGFSQSEKIKAGLIWANQFVETILGMPQQDRNGAEKALAVFIGMVASEIHVAQKMSPDDRWPDALQHVDRAMVMIRSSVLQEAPFHLSKALTVITSIGHETMTDLVDKKLL